MLSAFFFEFFLTCHQITHDHSHAGLYLGHLGILMNIVAYTVPARYEYHAGRAYGRKRHGVVPGSAGKLYIRYALLLGSSRKSVYDSAVQKDRVFFFSLLERVLYIPSVAYLMYTCFLICPPYGRCFRCLCLSYLSASLQIRGQHSSHWGDFLLLQQ